MSLPTDDFDSIYTHLTSSRGFPVLPAASPKPYEKKRDRRAFNEKVAVSVEQLKLVQVMSMVDPSTI